MYSMLTYTSIVSLYNNRDQKILRTADNLWSISVQDWPQQSTDEDGVERYPSFCTGMLYIYTQQTASRIVSVSNTMPCLATLDDVWATGYLAKLVGCG